MAYCSIVFIQGDSDETVNAFFAGNVSPGALITHLSQWDFGGENEHSLSVTETPPWGTSDQLFTKDEYTLSIGPLDYVGLTRECESLD